MISLVTADNFNRAETDLYFATRGRTRPAAWGSSSTVAT